MTPEIVVVGTGPGPVALLTHEARELLLEVPKVFFRTSVHPVYYWLEEQHKDLFCFDFAYTIPRMGYDDVYQLITQAILKEAQRRGRAVYALPGHPFVFETTTRLIHRGALEQGMTFRVVPGMSFLELIYAKLAIDPSEGLQIVVPGDLHPACAEYSEHVGLLIGLIGMRTEPDPDCKKTNVESVSRWLLERYPPGHPVSLAWTDGMPDYKTLTRTVLLRDLVQLSSETGFFASLYVPPVADGA